MSPRDLMLFVGALGAAHAGACETALSGRAANDQIAFVRTVTGEPVGLHGIATEILNARRAEARRGTPGSPPFALVIMNDEAVSWVFPAGAHLVDDPGVISDFLLESAAFHALRAQFPGETLLLTLLPARD